MSTKLDIFLAVHYLHFITIPLEEHNEEFAL